MLSVGPFVGLHGPVSVLSMLQVHLGGVKGFVATVKGHALQLLLVSDWNLSRPRPRPGEAVRNHLHVRYHMYVHYHLQAAYNAPRLLEQPIRNPEHSHQLFKFVHASTIYHTTEPATQSLVLIHMFDHHNTATMEVARNTRSQVAWRKCHFLLLPAELRNM